MHALPIFEGVEKLEGLEGDFGRLRFQYFGEFLFGFRILHSQGVKIAFCADFLRKIRFWSLFYAPFC